MKGVVKAIQFDPTKPYPEEAWCQGPGAFYMASPRGHIHIANTDWIVEFENGERIAISADTYEKYFKEPEPVLSAEEEGPEWKAEDYPKGRRSGKAK